MKSSNQKNQLSRGGFLRALGIAAGGGLLANELFDGGMPDELMAQSKYKQDIKAEGPIKSVIFLNMAGGMSHVDTFDPKPNGSFGKTRSAIPGAYVSDRLSKSAPELKGMSLIRSVHSREGSHERAQYLMHSGHTSMAGFANIPSLGAVIALARSKKGPYFPDHITIGGKRGLAGRGGFLGKKFGSFNVNNLRNPLAFMQSRGRVDESRLLRRELMLDLLNKNFAGRVAAEGISGWEGMRKSALEFMNSDRLSVFDLEQESAATKARYGDNNVGKGFLLARRLAQAEVPFIEVSVGGWDTHRNHRERMTTNLGRLDPALAALLGELRSTGLLKQTLVVLTSEFGRTPDISSNGDGRDHHPRAWTTLIGGGNVPQGTVIGETDKKGARVKKDPVRLESQVATIYKSAGIDPESNLKTNMGRPMQLVIKGESIF